jgi:hypothetical protein
MLAQINARWVRVRQTSSSNIQRNQMSGQQMVIDGYAYAIVTGYADSYPRCRQRFFSLTVVHRVCQVPVTTVVCSSPNVPLADRHVPAQPKSQSLYTSSGRPLQRQVDAAPKFTGLSHHILSCLRAAHFLLFYQVHTIPFASILFQIGGRPK